jgi:hypothetical protein
VDGTATTRRHIISSAKSIYNELKPMLGVRIPKSSQGQDQGQSTFFVKEIVPGGAADRAGLKVGDVIESCNGVETPTTVEVKAALASLGGGDEMMLTINRKEEKTDDKGVRTTRCKIISTLLLLGCDKWEYESVLRLKRITSGVLQKNDELFMKTVETWAASDRNNPFVYETKLASSVPRLSVNLSPKKGFNSSPGRDAKNLGSPAALTWPPTANTTVSAPPLISVQPQDQEPQVPPTTAAK